ncbi:MAG: glycosyltransferase family 2 protein [Symploca sp. SIO3E6]|nr:glycosyltransferase family 2 protein [Caldora sp. SIO3E6]
MTNEISIIIPVRNRKAYTQQILSQLYQQISPVDLEQISVVVVDDGSTDGTQSIIRTQFSRVHLLQGDGSLWWTGAICLGMEYARDKLAPNYFVWLNDDIVLAEDFISQLKAVCASPISCNSVIGGIVLDQTYPDWVVFSGMMNKQLIRSMDYFSTKETIEVDALNGNIAIIPRMVVDQIGLPNQDRFRHYGGDFEFIMRAKNSGYPVILSSKLQATTDYQVSDFIRYMPPWMQWYVATDNFHRKKILQGFTNLKCHYNIWHMVNINHYEVQAIPAWKYSLFYLRQIAKLLSSSFWRSSQVQVSINDYFDQQNAPAAIIAAVFKEKSREKAAVNR